MSSSPSISSARSDDPSDKEAMAYYSGNSESVNDASSSSEAVRGQEVVGPSGRAEAESPLEELFTYRAQPLEQNREVRVASSPKRTSKNDHGEGVGTSRPQKSGDSPANDQQLAIYVPELRDESSCRAEPLTLVKPEELEWAYNPEMEKKRLETWVGSGVVKAKKPKRARRRQRPPPGATWSTEESLETLRGECAIPPEVRLILPDVDQREDDPPGGTFTAYECWFRECFLTFPIPKIILRFVWLHRIALAQINTMGIRHLVGLLTRASECGESIEFRHLSDLLDLRKNQNLEGKNLYNLASRVHRKVIDGLPNKDHNWRKYFFFVPISPASVEHEYLRMAKWGTLGSFSK